MQAKTDSQHRRKASGRDLAVAFLCGGYTFYPARAAEVAVRASAVPGKSGGI